MLDYSEKHLCEESVGDRRCLELGAKEVFVGSDQEFYKAIGFSTLFKSNCWVREYRKENSDDAD